MAKRKVKKVSRKVAKKEVIQVSNKHHLALRDLIFFGALALICWGLYTIVTTEMYQTLFELLAIIFAFVALAFLIVWIALLFVSVKKK